MKKFIFILMCFMLCGCDIDDDFSDTYIYTTMYPVEYATNALYSDYSIVSSVYPNGADEAYEVTEKKKNQYSEGKTFVYSGAANEAYLAKDLLNLNPDIQIIDATKGMNINYSVTELWLDPSNYLMLCSNIKRSLINYNDNIYVKENIEEKYKELNERVSEIDVELYSVGKNGNYNTILTTNDVFNYLTKYNIEVISIDKDQESVDKAYADAKKKIQSNSIDYIYILEGEELTDQQEKFISENSLVKITIDTIYTLTDEEKEADKDYISMMKDIIDNYKKELYKQ